MTRIILVAFPNVPINEQGKVNKEVINLTAGYLILHLIQLQLAGADLNTKIQMPLKTLRGL